MLTDEEIALGGYRFDELQALRIVTNRTDLERKQDELGFPKPIKTGKSQAWFPKAEVHAWLRMRAALRDSAPTQRSTVLQSSAPTQNDAPDPIQADAPIQKVKRRSTPPAGKASSGGKPPSSPSRSASPPSAVRADVRAPSRPRRLTHKPKARSAVGQTTEQEKSGTDFVEARTYNTTPVLPATSPTAERSRVSRPPKCTPLFSTTPIRKPGARCRRSLSVASASAPWMPAAAAASIVARALAGAASRVLGVVGPVSRAAVLPNPPAATAQAIVTPTISSTHGGRNDAFSEQSRM
jgi:hypothetical protein